MSSLPHDLGAFLGASSCMGHIQGAHRPAVLWCPERREDDIAAEPPVRVLDALVDDRPLEARSLQRAPPRPRAGRPLTRLLWCSFPYPAIARGSVRVVAWHRRPTGRSSGGGV